MTPRSAVLFTGFALVLTVGTQRSGIDSSALDPAIRPQDDLYGHSNARWVAATPVPPDRVSYGAFQELADRTEVRLRGVLEDAAAGRTPTRYARQIGDLYASMMDEAGLDARGLAPAQPELSKIATLVTPAQFAREVGYLSSIAAGGPFGGTVATDPRDPRVRVARIGQGGTLLPERDYYLSPDDRFARLRDEYVRYLTRIFSIIGWPEPSDMARATLAFETSLARAQWTQVESRDSARTENRFTLGRLAADLPGFDWRAWAEPQGLDRADGIVLLQPSFFEHFARLTATTPMPTLRAWLVSRYITAVAPWLSRDVDLARFDFFGRILTGQEQPRVRWKRAVSLVSSYLGDAVGRLYVDRFFPESSRQRVEAIAAQVRAAFAAGLRDAEWMSPAARRAAREKLERVVVKVGFPEAWHDYGPLRIDRADLFGNVQRALQFQNTEQMRRLTGRADPGEWLITPQTVNAYYAPALNEIVLPAAVLQPPLFDPDADDAVNYGAIGAILGHELVHAFDDRGRTIDATGAVRDWWTAGDVSAFARLTAPIIAQYDAYEPLPGQHVNGRLTFTENVADIAGLALAYRAYRGSLDGRAAPTLDGLTGDQRFFIGWARAWRGKERDEYLEQMLRIRLHAPWRERANGPVSHIDAFHEAFGVQPGDELYRAPSERVRIW